MQACPRLNVVTDVGKLGITQISAITGFRSAVDVEKEVTVRMCKSVEKGAFHGTARPNAPLHGKKPPGGGRSHHRTGYVGSSQECSTESNPYESASEKPSVTSELFAVKKGSPESAIIVEPKVNGVILPMELDTGASVSLISERVWKESCQGRNWSSVLPS